MKVKSLLSIYMILVKLDYKWVIYFIFLIFPENLKWVITFGVNLHWKLTLSAWQTKTCANCLPFCFFFLFKTETSVCISGQVQIHEWKSSLQKLGDERVTLILTLKMPRKPAPENVICLWRLQNILANFSNLFLHTGKLCGPWSDCS